MINTREIKAKKKKYHGFSYYKHFIHFSVLTILFHFVCQKTHFYELVLFLRKITHSFLLTLPLFYIR